MNISSINQLFGAGQTGSERSGRSLTLCLNRNTGLKSTEQKMERMQKAAAQVDFYEQQKAGLKAVRCDTVEQIADKLEKFHQYEDRIAAVKMSYNHEQMFHVMDEAKETGEKIAEAAKKYEPKTAEERAEEAKKEALGIEDEGMLSEMLDEMEETVGDLAETMPEDTVQPKPEELEEQKLLQEIMAQEAETLPEPDAYQPMDIRI